MEEAQYRPQIDLPQQPGLLLIAQVRSFPVSLFASW